MQPDKHAIVGTQHRGGARRILSRPPSFFVGGVLGLGLFVYSALVPAGSPAFGELGVQTALSDGLRPQDLSTITILLLKAVGLVVVGGLIVEAISNRLFGGTGGSKT